MIKINTKVYPIKKTAEGWLDLKNSHHFRLSRDRGQEFLYVTGFEESENAYILSVDPRENDRFHPGDFYKEDDFVLWQEGFLVPFSVMYPREGE